MASRTPASGDTNVGTPRTTVDELLDDVSNLARRPSRFFATLDRIDRPLIVPLVFGLLGILLSAIAAGGLLVAGVDGVQGATYIIFNWSSIVTGQEMIGVDITGAGFLWALALTPVIGTVLLFGAALFFHSLVVLSVGDGNRGFQRTFRVVAYASVVNLINWIPVIGLPLNLIGLYFITLGIRAVHQTSAWRAWAVGLTLPIAFITFFILLQFLPE